MIKAMKKSNIFYRIWDLYYDGFRHMTIGKTLWLVIGIKLFIIFVVLKLIFFPDFLSTKARSGSAKADYISTQITNRVQK